MDNEATYICNACGEEIVIPIDLTEGTNQQYVEDCPVCCHPCVIQLQIREDGEIDVSANPEQDRM